MIPILNRLQISLKALRQLGLAQVSLYALYQLGLRTGHYRRSLPSPAPSFLPASPHNKPIQHKFPSPSGRGVRGEGGISTLLDALYPLTPSDYSALFTQADEICAGRVRLFGGPPVALELAPPGPLSHWTEYELGRSKPGQSDVKFIWEPARFSWAYTLGRAYSLSVKEDYAQSFWQYAERFLQANPPYLGPNWMSGQEVALRLIAFIYAVHAFGPSPHSSPQRVQLLWEAIAAHAGRIPLTLVYARSQNNNHLLNEAAGLYTAGLLLPDHPLAPAWRSQGWRWFNRALQSQIAADGSYVQHSTNYHRLMLQLALWVYALNQLPGGLSFPPATHLRLSAAARWLSALVDPETGQVPNLGANDGAYLMLLSPAPYSDFRVVTAAAIRQWGSGDEVISHQVSVISNQQSTISNQQSAIPNPQSPTPNHQSAINNMPLRAPEAGQQSTIRSFLRAVHFTTRPSHADQLHLDLWWRGLNVALDAGTFLYNAPPPWQNSLASTAVHNTVMVDGQEQMVRAGRFLWLDWAQAQVLPQDNDPLGGIMHLVASHDGYRRFGVIHQRNLDITSDQVTVVDTLLPASSGAADRTHTARLHWLLPDWPWTLLGNCLSLSSPYSEVRLEITGADSLSLGRAGELLTGPGPITPITGWYSPTYNQKIPALALIATAACQLPLKITTNWHFPTLIT